MKKLNLLIALLATVTLTQISSCKKYEDGPAISLRSKTARISGEWMLESFTVNDADKTADLLVLAGANYMVEIEKDGTYKIAGNFSDNGTWKFGEDKDDVYLQSSTAGSKEQAYRITRLANKELWMKQTQSNGDIWKYKYKQ
jgi:hypothetical protein